MTVINTWEGDKHLGLTSTVSEIWDATIYKKDTLWHNSELLIAEGSWKLVFSSSQKIKCHKILLFIKTLLQESCYFPLLCWSSISFISSCHQFSILFKQPFSICTEEFHVFQDLTCVGKISSSIAISRRWRDNFFIIINC